MRKKNRNAGDAIPEERSLIVRAKDASVSAWHRMVSYMKSLYQRVRLWFSSGRHEEIEQH